MSEKSIQIDDPTPEDRERIAKLVREGYLGLAGKDNEGNQLYEITPKGEAYFNRDEE